MDELLALEDLLSFKDFKHEDALAIGLDAIGKVKSRQWRRIGIRIVLDDLLIFQYLMDDKNEDEWLKRKEHTVIQSGHSSNYVYMNRDQERYSPWLSDPKHGVSGGGFPIMIDGVCRGVISISGMTQEADHALIVEVLKEHIAKKKDEGLQ